MDFLNNKKLDSDVVIVLLDKIEKVCGWIMEPKGRKRHQNESEAFFVEMIKNDNTLTTLEKTALISERRNIIKTYINQSDILNIAMEHLDTHANPEDVEDGWIMDFMDRCKNICEEDLQIIWGKILAEEYNKPGSISRRLLHILSIISKKEAEAFSEVNRNAIISVKTGEVIPIIYSKVFKGSLKREELLNLSSIGLVNYDLIKGFYMESKGNEKFKCGKKMIELDYEEGKGIYLGTVRYTAEGQVLGKMLDYNTRDGLYEDILNSRETRRELLKT